jgi:hypothetical protein
MMLTIGLVANEVLHLVEAGELPYFGTALLASIPESLVELDQALKEAPPTNGLANPMKWASAEYDGLRAVITNDGVGTQVHVWWGFA